MDKLFEKIGKSLGNALNKGKWIYQSAFGSEEDAYQAELKVSRDLIRTLKKDRTILSNIPEQKDLDIVGARLYFKFPNQKRGFRFYLIAGNEINAFALPGGIIFVTLGLFEKVRENEAEIAFVLAHEMIHIERKHLMGRIIANYSIQTVTKAVRPGGTLGIVASEVISKLLKSGFSQENELEADQGAVKLMKTANFDPLASISVLKKLAIQGNKNTSIYNYFSSHPSIEERINAIKQYL